ncbi:MAG: hypothetical protein L3J89_09855 [Gammaproteobacteria bacterium]|nr:hypothetical protein [Gammaproteobacteria bacterium]
MIKIIIISFLVIIAMLVLLVIFLWYSSLKQPPFRPVMSENYFVCREHKILEGGMSIKGPKRKYTQNTGKTWCWTSEWEEIDRKTFKNLATEWYGVDWSEETPYWRGD